MKSAVPKGADASIMVIGNTSMGNHYWVGRSPDGIDHFAGQTFKASKNGILRTIRIFPEMIIGETDALLSVFEFDAVAHGWNDKKGECKLILDGKNAKQWISFDMKQLVVDNAKKYAFKISCNHGGMMAIAECPWTTANPYPDGEQWSGSSKNPGGNFHRDFGLSFIAEIE